MQDYSYWNPKMTYDPLLEIFSVANAANVAHSLNWKLKPGDNHFYAFQDGWSSNFLWYFLIFFHGYWAGSHQAVVLSAIFGVPRKNFFSFFCDYLSSNRDVIIWSGQPIWCNSGRGSRILHIRDLIFALLIMPTGVCGTLLAFCMFVVGMLPCAFWVLSRW